MSSIILHIYKHLDEYKVASINFTAIILSFFETSKMIEKIFQILLLFVSVVFTIYKILELHDKRKKNKDKDE